MNIVNLTPHVIEVRLPSGDSRAILPSGVVARVTSRAEVQDSLLGIPVVTTVYGEPQGIPEPAEDTVYLVSALVLSAVKRTDVYAPDTGPESVVRDEAGKIVAVRRLIRSV